MSTTRTGRVAALFATLSLLSAPGALAAEQDAEYDRPYTFETVDAYEANDRTFIIVTGVLQGETSPRTLRFWAGGASDVRLLQLQRCDRMALLTMSKAGRYYFQVTRYESVMSPLGVSCKLTRR